MARMTNTGSYQIIARRYRPQTFGSVVGQDAIVTTLKNALRFKRLAQAYLFCGFKGTGKTSIARIFAKALNCDALTEGGEPCNSCPSCLLATQGRSLDILEIDGASNRGIDDIRQINETALYAPAAGKYKIYIIDEVHMLTKEAFNALLKTLEEPPANVKFLFATTEPHKVLATIASRCQRFELARIPEALIASKLTQIGKELNIQIDPEALHLIAHCSEGCLRDAESLLDQVVCSAEGKITAENVSLLLGRIPHSQIFALDEAIWTNNLSFAFELAQQLISSGKEIAPFVDLLMEHHHLLLQLKLRPKVPLPSFLSTEEQKHYLTAESRYTESTCLYILDLLTQAAQQMSKTPFKRVPLEMLLLHLIRSPLRVSIDTLIARLVKLEHKTEKIKSLPEEKKSVTATLAAKQIEPPSLPQHTYDTLLRFAAVELEGSLKQKD